MNNREAGNMVDYPDEDAAIRSIFEEELKKEWRVVEDALDEAEASAANSTWKNRRELPVRRAYWNGKVRMLQDLSY